MARSCATKDANNKDYVCKPNIPAGINCPPPSKTMSRVTRVVDHRNTLSGNYRTPVGSDEGPCETVSFILDEELGRRSWNTAEERRVTAGVTGPGAGATREERHQSRPRGRRVQEWKRRQEGREAPPANVNKITSLTDTMKKGYTEEEIFAVLFESEKEKKRRQMLAIMTKTVAAHRLQKMRDLLTFEKLATWRRINGFDRVVDGEDNWLHGHRSLPPSPQEYTASLSSESQKLKNAISMPAETPEPRPWQKTMVFVDGLKGKFPDE